MNILRPAHRRLLRNLVAVFCAVTVLGVATPAVASGPEPYPYQGAYGNSGYVVRPGDTLAEIAAHYGTTVDALMAANGLRNPNKIYVGQTLTIPMGSMGMGGASCANSHQVRRGETLSEIAMYYGLDAYELGRANGIYDLNRVYYGETLCIPGGGRGGPTGQPMPAMPKAEPAKQPMAPKPEPPRQYNEQPGKRPDAPAQRYEEPMMPAPYPSDGPPPRGQDDMRYPDDGPRYRDEGPKEGGRDMNGPRGDDGRPMDGPHYDGPQYEPPRADGSHGDRPSMDGPKLRAPTEYWKGSYFKDKYFSEFVEERRDVEVRFNWYTENPFPGMPNDRFSVRWEKVEYFKEGRYRFFAVADDGVRVYVDDQLIIDGWKIQPATEYTGDIHLGDGLHKLVVEYYEEAEDAQIHVYWHPWQKRY